MWLLITIFAYLLNAVAMVVDKTLLKKEIENPVVYAFYIAFLGAVIMLAVLPFFLFLPSATDFFVSLLAGAAFAFALVLMFMSLKKDDASRVTPMIGGLVSIFVLFFASFLVSEKLTVDQYLGAFLLFIGTILISFDLGKSFNHNSDIKKISFKVLPQIRNTLWLALSAALFFAFSHVLSKYVYDQITFWPGFIWTRFGAFLTVLLMFIVKDNRRALINSFKKSRNSSSGARTGGLLIFGQFCGGSSAFLVQYATALSLVSLVQALQGIQYVFVFALVIILTKFYPRVLKEKLSQEVVWQKISALFLICLGLYLVAF